jgi:hypothetical protein
VNRVHARNGWPHRQIPGVHQAGQAEYAYNSFFETANFEF